MLTQLTRDMDRKIERAKERAALESAPRQPNADEQMRLDNLTARETGALTFFFVFFWVLTRIISLKVPSRMS